MRPEERFSQEFRAALKLYEGPTAMVFGFRIETSHTCPGAPDWCVLASGGRVIFVELKVNSGFTKSQKVIHKLWKALGINIRVLRKKDNGVILDDSLEPRSLQECVKLIIDKE